MLVIILLREAARPQLPRRMGPQRRSPSESEQFRATDETPGSSGGEGQGSGLHLRLFDLLAELFQPKPQEGQLGVKFATVVL